MAFHYIQIISKYDSLSTSATGNRHRHARGPVPIVTSDLDFPVTPISVTYIIA